MRKMLIGLAMISLGTVAMAQDNTETPVLKNRVATNSFWSNWFVTAGGDILSTYSDQEYSLHLPTMEPFRKLRRSFTGHFAVGKWITPGFGMRTVLGYGKIRQVNSRNIGDGPYDTKSRKWGYVGEQVLFNLSNVICGYKADRVYNFIPYVGVAESRDFQDNAFSFVPMAGILNTFRLTNRLKFNVEIYGMIGEDNVDGRFYAKYETSRKWWKAHDRILAGSVGFTYEIGKNTWDNIPDVDAVKNMYQSQIDGLNSQINDLRSQLNDCNNNANDLSKKLKDCQSKPVPVVEQKQKMESVVTFRCDKTVIDASQMPNVERVATYMKNNPNSKVVIKGYASPEGPKDHNMKLASDRAESVKNCLVKKYKINASRIEAAGNGIGDMFSEPSWNRVSICTIDQ
jgi:OOP family OmpA-OmpF porin